MFDWLGALLAVIACSLLIGLLGVLWFVVCLARWLYTTWKQKPELPRVWLSPSDEVWIDEVAQRLEA